MKVISYTCFRCGFTGKEPKTSASAYAFGKCEKCESTNIEPECVCECGAKMVEASGPFGNLKTCPTCNPPDSSSTDTRKP